MSVTSPGIDSYFTQASRRFALRYEQDEAFHERYQVWTRLLDRYARDKTSAIDLGCGSGIFSFYLADQGLSVTGLDAASGMIDLCREQLQQRQQNEIHSAATANQVTFLQAKLPYLRGVALAPADLVIASSVLEYVSDLETALKQMRRLVHDDGAVIVSLPNRASYYRRLERWRHRLTGRPAYYELVRHVVTLAELTQAATTAGLTLTEHAYYAHDTRLGRLLRRCQFPPHRTENLLAAVFQPAA